MLHNDPKVNESYVLKEPITPSSSVLKCKRAVYRHVYTCVPLEQMNRKCFFFFFFLLYRTFLSRLDLWEPGATFEPFARSDPDVNI